MCLTNIIKIYLQLRESYHMRSQLRNISAEINIKALHKQQKQLKRHYFCCPYSWYSVVEEAASHVFKLL